ncbi:MAG: peptidoglycan-binding protein [Planctomycetota bacterium]
MRSLFFATVGVAIFAIAAPSSAVDFQFYGRSGDGIELDFGSLPGVAAGAAFSNASLEATSQNPLGATTLFSSSLLSQGNFATDGRLWLFPDPNLSVGDTRPDERGFQGTLRGSVDIDGVAKTFAVTVQPGYTGVGEGSVGQSLEGFGRTNNPLFVAQQQQRLRYLGYVRAGGGRVSVSGIFDTATDEAIRTFQGVFIGGNNTSQANTDGIIGPITAGWLNAGNAPRWGELIDPDPQTPGTFSVSRMMGDFDILPARDPGTGIRTGNTPQTERFGSSWMNELIFAGAPIGREATNRPLLINALSTVDGYGSACCHNTHRVGMDIDMHLSSASHDFGNGFVDFEEQLAVDHVVGLVEAGRQGLPELGRIQRVIISNLDVRDALNALYPGIAIGDSSGVHLNHFHIDVGAPAQQAGLANLAGDFNLDGVVDVADYTVWRDGLGATHDVTDYLIWRVAYRGGVAFISVPEPTSGLLMSLAVCGAFARRRASSRDRM